MSEKPTKIQRGNKSNKAMDALTEILDGLDLMLNDAHSRADLIISDYWAWTLAESEKQSRGNKSALGLRVQRTKTGVTIQWYHIKWIKINDKWKTFSTYIRKGRRNNGYPESALGKYIKEWQHEKVWKTENSLSKIREHIQKLTDARKATGILIKRMVEINTEEI